MGILGGPKNQKSGKCHELSRKSTKKKLTVPGGGVESTFQKCGKLKKNLPRKIIIKCNPHLIRLTPSDGGGVTGENFKVTKRQVLKSISGMQLSWAKPGNPRAGW